MIDPRNLGDRLDAADALDRVAHPVPPRRPQSDTERTDQGRTARRLAGPPLHPLLTDPPIGFWTSAVVLDIGGGWRAERAADALVGLGVAAAFPTAAAGLADSSEFNEPEQRSGVVHAAANLAATGLYALSFVARRRGARSTGVALGFAGAAAATLGGFLGRHLTFRRGADVNQTAGVSSNTDWAEITVDGTNQRSDLPPCRRPARR